MKTIQITTELLKNANIRPSFLRLKIYNYLYKNKNHPTVDMIFKELNEEIPTLSKTSVYNTLKLFVEKNLTQIINIEDNETRYDADISTHGHFKCLNCGMIYDFSFNSSKINIDDLKDFEINQTHIYIKGVCKNCQN